MNHFHTITFFELCALVLGARHDLLVAFDRHQRVAEPE